MDINPLIADLNKYEDELSDSIMIAIGFNELYLADRYVAHAMAEIRGKKHEDDSFKQLAEIYNLPIEEVVKNIRKFTNRRYKTDFLPGNPKLYGDIKFDPV
jgi:hypothetical protein